MELLDHTLIYRRKCNVKTLEALDEEGFHLVKVPFSPYSREFSE